jgi:hypothetical protein
MDDHKAENGGTCCRPVSLHDRQVADDSALVADRLGNTLSHFALEITPPATQCGQMISYVFASCAFSMGISGPADLGFFS